MILLGKTDQLANTYHVIFTTVRQLALRTIFETQIPLLKIVSGQPFPPLKKFAETVVDHVPSAAS